MRELAGKVAVVTGAARGIGRALSERFAADGMRVALADVDLDGLRAVESSLRAGGATVTAVRCDSSRSEDVEALAAHAVAELGGVHVVCNNAGVMGTGDAWSGPLAEWEWVLGVNFFGVLHGVRTFLPLLQAQGEGHIVNTASMAGLTTMPGAAPYVVSKHAVVALSENLYVELAMSGSPIGVSVLCPGFVRTGLMDSPWDAARGERPPAATDSSAVQTQRLLHSGIDSGMPAAEVADQVVDAIRAERFWILTHPETRRDPIERALRASWQENPALGAPSSHPLLARARRRLRALADRRPRRR